MDRRPGPETTPGRSLLTRLRSLISHQPAQPPEDPKKFGAWGEQVAVHFLRKRGMKVLGRNYRRSAAKGEIDLVAWDRDTLVFVEVKTRRSKQVRVGEAAVNFSKRRALVRAARVYLRRQRRKQLRWRYDVVSVYPGPEVEYFPGAFTEEVA